MFVVFRHCLLRLGEGPLVRSSLTMRAHHPLIEKVQSLINNKPAPKEPDEGAVGKGTTAEVSSSPATTDPHHTCLQQDAAKPQTGITKTNDPGAVEGSVPSCSPDSTTPANVLEDQEVSHDPVHPRVGDAMLEQLSMAPRWATAWRPSPSLGGDSEEESCREELRGILRDLHNYR